LTLIVSPRVSRRDVLRVACGYAISSAFVTGSACAGLYSRGCILTPEGFAAYSNQSGALYTLVNNIFSNIKSHHSTGNADLDRELNRALRGAGDIIRG